MVARAQIIALLAVLRVDLLLGLSVALVAGVIYVSGLAVFLSKNSLMI